MAEVEARALTKAFATGKKVLDCVSFAARDGEFLSLLGPSGCGKTTLLRIIAGLDSPDRGSVWIGGRDVSLESPKDRDVAMVFQSYALYPHMSVEENIAMGLRLRGASREDIRARVDRAASKLGLSELLARRPGTLSGGQRQRVALARAMVRRPKVFLLDEPLSNLDALLREKTRAELKMLFRELQSTAIYVTHDQIEAMTLSDKVVVLNAGRIQQIGTPREIYHKPANTFVAGFLGSPAMNVFPLAAAESAGLVAPKRMPPAGRWLCGVRPEDVMVETKEPAGGGSG